MFRNLFRNYPLWACYSDGGGSGEGDSKSDPPAGDGDGDGAGKEPEKPFAVFPDSASFNARLEREAKSKLKEQAEAMGFESIEAMQEAAKKAKEAEEQSKSDLDKEKDRANRLEAEKASIVEAANNRLISAELKVYAAQAGIVDPDAAVTLADRNGVSVEDDGSIKGAKEAIDDLAKNKPYLLGKANKGVGSPGSPGGDPGNLSEEEQGKKLAEERRAAREQKSTGYDPWATQ